VPNKSYIYCFSKLVESHIEMFLLWSLPLVILNPPHHSLSSLTIHCRGHTQQGIFIVKVIPNKVYSLSRSYSTSIFIVKAILQGMFIVKVYSLSRPYYNVYSLSRSYYNVYSLSRPYYKVYSLSRL
jgi:hypothetical protein